MPLPINPPSGGILVKGSTTVNIQTATTSPNIDFGKLDLSDLLDIIEVLTKTIISNNRRRIKKNNISNPNKLPT